MKKKIVAVMMAMLMVLPLAGCGNENDQVSETEKTVESQAKSETEEKTEESSDQVSDEIPVDYFAGTELEFAIVANGWDGTKDFNDKMICQAAEEATGIHINWIVVDSGVKSERLNAYLASGELPDALLGFFGTDSTIINNKELLYDLSEEGLLETYAPDVLATYEAGGQGVFENLVLSDGSIRSLVAGMGSERNSDFGNIWYINKRWLENVGKDVPTTAEEFYDVMCAFRDMDANGNGIKDELPISFQEADWGASIINFANSFGIAGDTSQISKHYFNLKEGTIVPTLDTDEFRAFLEYYNKLASEGLLDVEGFSQTNDQLKAKVVEDKVGLIQGWMPSSLGVDDNDWIGMAPFKALDDVEPVKTGALGTFYGNYGGFVVSADCENVEAVLHWWNYISSTLELRMLGRRGVEGIGWYKAEDGKAISARLPEVTDEDFKNFVDNQNIGNNSCAYISPADLGFQYDENNIRHRSMAVIEPFLTCEPVPTKFVSDEASTERDFLEADLLPMISNFIGTSIVDGISDASWEKFLKDLETFGYYDWIEWWQNYADGTL